jgi:hypothetical protein
MDNKVVITEDSSSEMLRITVGDECLFEGNYWDFNRDGTTFKRLFKSIGAEVELVEKDYD